MLCFFPLNENCLINDGQDNIMPLQKCWELIIWINDNILHSNAYQLNCISVVVCNDNKSITVFTLFVFSSGNAEMPQTLEKISGSNLLTWRASAIDLSTKLYHPLTVLKDSCQTLCLCSEGVSLCHTREKWCSTLTYFSFPYVYIYLYSFDLFWKISPMPCA